MQASWLSGGLSQRQITPQAAPSSGQPRPMSRSGAVLAGHVGLVLSTWWPTARAHFSMRSRKRARLASTPTASRSAARLPLYLVMVSKH